MSITSLGYENTVFEDDEWAAYIARVGGDLVYGCDPGAWKPTTGVGLRAVKIAAGVIWGHGIQDDLSVDTTLNLASVSSGARYDLIVARRVWAEGASATTLHVITGTSTRGLPVRAVVPGTGDDQPIALVKVIPGSVVGEIIDLRIVGVVAFDILTLSYMDDAGTQLFIDDTLWTAKNTATWVETVADIPSGRAVRSTPDPRASSPSHSRMGLVVGSGRGGVTFSPGGQLVVPRPGRYLLTARAAYDANATGLRGASFTIDGTIVEQFDMLALPVVNKPTYVTTSTVRDLNAEMAVGLGAMQTSGAPLNVFEAILTVTFLSPS